MDIRELLMINDSDIDYSGLSAVQLQELALCDEPYIATTALQYLAERDDDLARTTVFQILQLKEGDLFLKSFAISISLHRNWFVESIGLAIKNGVDGKALKTLVESVVIAGPRVSRETFGQVREFLDQSTDPHCEELRTLLMGSAGPEL